MLINNLHALNVFNTIRWQHFTRTTVHRICLLNPAALNQQKLCNSSQRIFPFCLESLPCCCDSVLRYQVRYSYPCSMLFSGQNNQYPASLLQTKYLHEIKRLYVKRNVYSLLKQLHNYPLREGYVSLSNDHMTCLCVSLTAFCCAFSFAAVFCLQCANTGGIPPHTFAALHLKDSLYRLLAVLTPLQRFHTSRFTPPRQGGGSTSR